jgi:hypothetical protein
VTPGQRAGGVVRGLLGAVSLVGGLTWILLNLDAPRPVSDLIVGLVLAAGGLVLLMPHRVDLPGRATAAATAGAAIGGTLAGSVATTITTGGAFVYVASHGWPHAWLARGATAPDPVAARVAANQSSWQADAVNLVADLYFWALVGLLLLAAFVLIRRTGARRQAVLHP